MKSGKVVLGVLAGVAAGSLMGILFAPDKGSKTRKRILRKGNNYADDLKEKLDELTDVIGRKYDNARDEAERFVAKGKSEFQAAKNDAKQ